MEKIETNAGYTIKERFVVGDIGIASTFKGFPSICARPTISKAYLKKAGSLKIRKLNIYRKSMALI